MPSVASRPPLVVYAQLWRIPRLSFVHEGKLLSVPFLRLARDFAASAGYNGIRVIFSSPPTVGSL